MQSYQVIYSLVYSTIAGGFWLIFGKENLFPPHVRKWVLLGAVPVLAFLFQKSDAFARFLLEDLPVSQQMRKTLAGKNYIEGDWPLIVVDVSSKQLLYYGYLTIDFADGQLVIAGRDWKTDGTAAHDFESQQARYSEGRLQYWYEQGQNGEMRGYTEIYFFPKHRRPERHAGEFLDKQHKSVRFYAKKLEGVPLPRSEKERLGAAKAFWKEFEPGLTEALGRPISTDWE